MQPNVSVIIAAYNAAPYLRQTLDSLRTQTLHDIEIIIVDDCSTDETPAILQEYSQKESRISILEPREETAGGGAARNLGISQARGKYLSILDADDIFLPEMLARAYEAAETAEADIVLFDGDLFNDQRQIREPCDFIMRQENLPETASFAPQTAADHLFQMSIGAAWNLLLRCDLVQREHLQFESLHNSNDTTFTLLALATAKRITVLQEKLILYRRYHRQGTSVHDSRSKWPLDVCEALWRVRQGLEERGIYDVYQTGFIRRALELTLLYLRRRSSDWPAFCRMYQGMQQDYAEKLDFANISEAAIGDPMTAAQRSLLLHASPEAFSAAILQSSPMSSEAASIPKGARVAIYGAGDKGADFFHQVYRSHCWQIVCWADRDYERLGWPVVSPQAMVELHPDYVLIAIENQDVCQAVRQDLQRRGMSAETILPALAEGKGFIA